MVMCIQATVHGRVQGVFYRDTTRKKARALGITGWVKNNADGTVSLHACGDADKIKLLIDWLWKGSLLSRVTQVAWSEIPVESHAAFTIC